MTDISLTKVYYDLKKLAKKKIIPHLKYLESASDLTFVLTESSYEWHRSSDTLNSATSYASSRPSGLTRSARPLSRFC